MDDRTKQIFAFSIFGAALFSSACGFSQPTRFQMSFLPSAPHPLAPDSETLPAAPAVQPNLYLQQAPPFLLASAQLPPRKTSGDAIVMRAEQAFQRGKRFYQANDIPGD